MQDVIENLQRKDEKIYITFNHLPKEFRKEERIMNSVRNLNSEYKIGRASCRERV